MWYRYQPGCGRKLDLYCLVGMAQALVRLSNAV